MKKNVAFFSTFLSPGVPNSRLLTSKYHFVNESKIENTKNTFYISKNLSLFPTKLTRLEKITQNSSQSAIKNPTPVFDIFLCLTIFVGVYDFLEVFDIFLLKLSTYDEKCCRSLMFFPDVCFQFLNVLS